MRSESSQDDIRYETPAFEHLGRFHAFEQRDRRCPSGAHAGAVGAARRLQSAARSGLASRNSLRSLRSLRSDSRDESDDEARCARRARPCAAPRPRNRPRQTPPVAKHQRRFFVASSLAVSAKACAVSPWCASEAPRSAGLVARARSAHRSSDSSRLFERSERSERSEFRDGAAGPSIAGKSALRADRFREAPWTDRTRLCRSEHCN